MASFSFEIKNSLKGRERRKKVIEIVESFKDVLKLKEILDALGISFSTYYRYRSEILGCILKAKTCDSSFGRSLSHENQKKMIEMAQSKIKRQCRKCSFRLKRILLNTP